ncbi:hypothetical protein AHAS_Ahas02G0203800 [Arachis hypogaea]
MKVQPVLLLLVISIILCTCPGHVVSGLCLDDQRSFLLQFKNNLTFDHQHSTKLNSWNESIACCDWSGVTCDHDARVIALDLSHTKFSGGLPLSIGNLVHLSILHLYNCNFSGTIPTSLSNLTELKEMDLSHNNFVGAIPSSALFEGMKNLSIINLSHNSISGIIPSSLFMIPSLLTCVFLKSILP